MNTKNNVPLTDWGFHRRSFSALVPLFLIGLPFILSGCAAVMNLPAHWSDHPIVVDGRNNEWDVTYLIDDNKLVIGFLNDSNYVYLMLATNDRGIATSLMRGLTVWFDPKGGTDRIFGLRYPLGGIFGREGRGRQEGVGAQFEPPQELGMSATDIEILGPGKDDVHKMGLMETGGIQAKVSFSGSTFVCEMRIPYRDSYPFSIKATPGSVIGMEIETAQGLMQRRAPGGEQGGEVGGMEGGPEGDYGRGGTRGGRGGFGGGGSGLLERLDIWLKSQLISSGGARNPTPGKN